jgi:hypothetical protein
MTEISATLSAIKSRPEEIPKVGFFLDSLGTVPNEVEVLMEIPGTNVSTTYANFLALLAKKGYCKLSFQALENGQVLFTAPGVKPLAPHIAKSYAQFLTGRACSIEECAVVAALIAKERDVFYFLTSRGIVHSSQDILQFMRECVKNNQYRWASVASGEEIYTLERIAATRFDNLDTIPLEYALAATKHAFLRENDALKFALLAVCNLWSIRLRCSSSRNQEANLTQHQKEIFGQAIFDPPQGIASWITAAFRSR